MSQYLISIILRSAHGADYAALEALLLAHGYKRWVEAWEGTEVPLPPREYAICSPASTEQIRDLVLQLARRSGLAAIVRVTLASEMAWALAA